MNQILTLRHLPSPIVQFGRPHGLHCSLSPQLPLAQAYLLQGTRFYPSHMALWPLNRRSRVWCGRVDGNWSGLDAIYARCKMWKWKGYNINYFVGGEGPALLLVHGFGASIGHWRRFL